MRTHGSILISTKPDYRISLFERPLSNDRLVSEERRVKRGHYDGLLSK